jgi:hypothetical protein
MTSAPIHPHGATKARGCSHIAPSKFSKLFPDATPVAVTPEEAALIGGPGGLMHDFDGSSGDSAVPAGYIFFSQFIDHDITLDTTTDLRGDPRSVHQIAEVANIRSPSLDLDCVYGFGPEASPHIYDGDRPGRLAIAPNGRDLARSPTGAALIGDPRNDENIFVAQMHLLFHRFHNKLYNERVYQEPGEAEFHRFEKAQEETRYHYQWLVLFDLLKRICDRDVYKHAAHKLIDGDKNFPYFFGPDHGKLTMPVEFSVAAYRVGHTMVRSEYAVNDRNLDVELFDERFRALGFGEVPEDLVVDWRYMLPVDRCLRPRMSKAFDPLLADEIQNMPRPVVNSNNPADRALAFRNLLRGNVMSLTSGQEAAKLLRDKGYPIPTPDVNPLDEVPGWKAVHDRNPGLTKATPLFYYILLESRVRNGGQRFGPVGSAILMDVFGGMLKYCNSFLDKKDWNPDPCVSKERWSWWSERYRESFDRKTLVDRDDYFPFELADVVRFVEDWDESRSASI